MWILVVPILCLIEMIEASASSTCTDRKASLQLWQKTVDRRVYKTRSATLPSFSVCSMATCSATTVWCSKVCRALSTAIFSSTDALKGRRSHATIYVGCTYTPTSVVCTPRCYMALAAESLNNVKRTSSLLRVRVFVSLFLCLRYLLLFLKSDSSEYICFMCDQIRWHLHWSVLYKHFVYTERRDRSAFDLVSSALERSCTMDAH